MDKTSKIYIAGHTGLVGSAIWKVFESNGYTNLTGKEFNELDLRNQTDVSKFFCEEQPEYVIVAAAKVGGIFANNTYRAEFIYDNLMIESNIINEAYKNNVKKLIFLGSTCIYPRDTKQPILEEALLTGPLEYTNESYAIAKIAGMKLCDSYNIQYDTNFISLMPTNIYGPGDSFNLETSHVLPALFRKIYLGFCLENNNYDAIKKDFYSRPIEGISGNSSLQEIDSILTKYGIIKRQSYYNEDNKSDVNVEIWGTGKPMREFLWSEDLADAILFVMENIDFDDITYGIEEIRNSHLNIGTGTDLSIRDLSYLIKEILGFQGGFIFNKSKPDGTYRKTISVERIHKLGWHHKINLDEGIKLLYEWYLKY